MNRCENDAIITDYGPEPFIANIDCMAKENVNFRTAMWTGKNLQVTFMSLPVGGEIGLEMHNELDQFLRIEDGLALVKMGQNKSDLTHIKRVNSSFAVIVPAGCWHNIINIGRKPLKIYSIYAPVQHPFGTVHKTKKDAEHEQHD